MTLTPYQLQMGTDTARGERAGRMCRLALAVDDAQGRGHPLPVGGACFCSLRQDDASLLTGRGFAPRPFSIQTAGGCGRIPKRRRALGVLHRRLAVKYVCCALIGRSHQLYRISDKPGSDLAYPFHRSNLAPSHEHDPRARQNGQVPNSTGAIPKFEGARPNERG